MQLGFGTTVFPAWSAAAKLVTAHGTGAVQHAQAAVRAGDGATRLDEAVRAMTSFDHAVDNARKLPVEWLVPNARRYFAGYELARQAVTLLVASGAIPGANERVGRQSLLAARESFHAGVEAARAQAGAYRRHLAGGWLEATNEDARTGVLLLRQTATGPALLAGIARAQSALQQGGAIDEQLVRSVDELFDRSTRALEALERDAGAGAPGAVDEAAFARAGELLERAAALVAERA